MMIKDVLLPEFDHEMALTRKVLARIPEDKFGWQPHEKSMTLGRLAGHLAEIPGWVKESLTQDGLDMGGEHKPDVVGFSAFLTTTMPMFKANINALQKAGLRDQVIVMVGGAPVTQEYADVVGADGYAADASAAVARAKELLRRRRAMTPA